MILSNKHNMTDLQIINLLQETIELAKDVAPSLFTSEEYKAMYNFLNRLREQYKNESA